MFVYTLLLILHVIISICLMAIVLVQSGKGGGLAGAFGGAGATQTMFGGRGAGDFLTRTTQILGAAFMITSLVLVLLGGSANRSGLSSESQRIIQEIQEAAAQSAAPVGAADLPPLQGFPEEGGAGGLVTPPAEGGGTEAGAGGTTPEGSGATTPGGAGDAGGDGR
jgi:preprotein translocase subunit SecG